MFLFFAYNGVLLSEAHVVMHKNQIIIWLLAGFLITYHTMKIYTGLVAADGTLGFAWSHVDSIRLWIIGSLLLVIMFKRLGLLSMWLSIVTLVVLNYLNLPVTADTAAQLGLLKGLLIPTIITALFWHNHRPSKQAEIDKKKPAQ